MKKRLTVGEGRVRVWRDEYPFSFETFQSVDRKAAARRAGRAVAGTVTMEIWMPKGKASLYGLLGVRFQPRPKAKGLSVHVQVTTPHPTDDPFKETIAPRSEGVKGGLPKPLAEAVATALVRECKAQDLGAGLLSQETAAYGPGSSPAVFAALAELVVKMLALRIDDGKPAEIAEVVRAALEA